jgi:hypothetical protein
MFNLKQRQRDSLQSSPHKRSEVKMSLLPSLEERLASIEACLRELIERQTIRDWYTVEEFSRQVGREPFTVREWARLGRIHAEKRRSGRGAHAEWVISHLELLRFQRHGLLPQFRPK